MGFFLRRIQNHPSVFRIRILSVAIGGCCSSIVAFTFILLTPLQRVYAFSYEMEYEVRLPFQFTVAFYRFPFVFACVFCSLLSLNSVEY